MDFRGYGLLNLNRSSFEIALDLLYIENQLKLHPKKTKLGTPMELDTRPDDPWDANSFIPLEVDASDGQAIPTSGTGLEFHRISFDEAGLIITPIIPVGTNIYSILPHINRMYRFQLTEQDILNDTIVDPKYVNLTAHPKSLAWQGKGKAEQRDHLLTVLKLDCFKEYVAPPETV